ncbi:MAG: hypothetical protein AB7V50_00685 [Vampirovibrionia bacterium]
MRHSNISSWAQDFEYEDLTEEASNYNLPLDLIDEACELLNQSCSRSNKKKKFSKVTKECWQ